MSDRKLAFLSISILSALARKECLVRHEFFDTVFINLEIYKYKYTIVKNCYSHQYKFITT